MPIRVAILVVLVLALGAPAAHAGTVALETTDTCECDAQGGTDETTYTLRWTGDPGEANTATVSWTSDALHLRDETAPVTPGNGCTAAGPNEATCATPAGCQPGPRITCTFVFELTLDGGDGDDALRAGAMPALPSRGGVVTQSVSLELDGGDGDDLLGGSGEDDVLQGGAGRDTLQGGEGSDVLVGDGIGAAPGAESPADAPAAADTIDGGPDADTVAYTNRAQPVFVDLGAGTPAGELGEGDQLTGIENIDGGAGSDVLTGDAGANEIWGAGGADKIDGGARSDTLVGGTGRDELHGGAGNDLLQGDGARENVDPPPPPSSDVVDGGDGTDTASWAGRLDPIRVDLSDSDPDGESDAPDTLTSIENVEGGSGKDALIGDNGPNALDGGGGADSLTGGGGADQLRVADTGGTVDGGAGNDLIRAGTVRLTCGRGLDRVSVINLAVPGGDCEILAFLSYLWDPIRGEAQTPLLELKNAVPRTTRTAVSLRLRCPKKACRGVVRLGTGTQGVGDGRRKLRLRGTAFRQVRLPLSKQGRRRVARGRARTTWLRFGGELAPVVVKLRR